MAGHSQFKNIMHRKGAADARRSKVFSKLAKEITVAAKLGAPDPAMNPRLRLAVQNARAENMPKDNIERAIKKGAGELEGEQYEEVIYEGYGPGGAAVMVDTVTDNRNRTVSEIRHLFGKYGGNLGASGCVAYLFERKGLFLIATESTSEEQLMEILEKVGSLDKNDKSFVTEANVLGYLD